MMSIVVALVAWVAASEASAVPMDVIHIAQDTTTRNVTQTSILGSNASLETSSYADKYDERTGWVPTELETILLHLSTSRLQNLTPDEKTAKIAELLPQIRAVNDMVTGLPRATEHGTFFEGTSFLAWVKSVRNLYEVGPDVANRAMFEILAHHFKSDHYDLASALVDGTKDEETKKIAEKLQDLQVQVWMQEGRGAANVFELLNIHQINGNPFESKLFFRWVAFVEARYHHSPEEAKNQMLSVLAECFEEDDLVLVKALVNGAKLRLTKDIAEKLLDYQMVVWVNEGKNLTKVFELLEPTQTKSKFLASKLFSKWVGLLMATYTTNYQKVTIDFLADHYKGDELFRVLIAGTKIPGAKRMAEKLLGFQFDVWVDEPKSHEEILKRLGHHQTNGNPLESLLFSKWSIFVKLQRRGSAAGTANQAILDMLEDQFGSKNALISALSKGVQTYGTKQITGELLNYQYNVWKEKKKSAADLFEDFELNRRSDHLFDNPLFYVWVDFIRSSFMDDQEAIKAIIWTLKGVYKNRLEGVLTEGTETQITSMRSLAKILLRALQEGTSELPKRQNSDLERPPSKRQNDDDFNEPPAKWQKNFDFDLNEPSPEMKWNPPTPRAG